MPWTWAGLGMGWELSGLYMGLSAHVLVCTRSQLGICCAGYKLVWAWPVLEIDWAGLGVGCAGLCKDWAAHGLGTG
jgi:hypothetical protein